MTQSDPRSLALQVVALIFSIIGFAGFIMLIIADIRDLTFDSIVDLGMVCMGGLLLLFSFPAALISIIYVLGIRKGSRVLPVVSLVLSAPPIFYFLYLEITGNGI